MTTVGSGQPRKRHQIKPVKPPKTPKAPKPPKAERRPRQDRATAVAPARTVRLGEREEASTWRPKWLQYEKNSKRSDVADAVRSLGIMLSTSRGETVPLATLAKQYAGTELGSAFGRIYEAVQSGQMNMADAVKAEKVFPKIVGDLLTVGSRSGTAATHLQRAADIIDAGSDLSHKIRSAVMQPVILLGVIIAFLYAVILFVLPVFAGMFASFGKPLPPLSQAVLAAGNGLAWGGAGIAVLLAGWFGYYRIWGRHNKALRIKLGRLQLKVPVIGKVLRSQRLTQVFSILASLLTVGMSERDALVTAAEASGNAAVQDHLERHIAEMDRGSVDFADVADGFLIPLQAGFMLRNGFDSGAEVQALDDLAKVYQRDANKRADNLTTAIEPIANGIVGIVFAAIIISVYLPVYDMFVGLTQV